MSSFFNIDVSANIRLTCFCSNCNNELDVDNLGKCYEEIQCDIALCNKCQRFSFDGLQYNENTYTAFIRSLDKREPEELKEILIHLIKYTVEQY